MARLFYVMPEYPPDFKYEEYILYTTRRGPVSGVPLKNNLNVFLACSLWC